MLVNTHLVETSISGVRYMPCTFFTALIVPGIGADRREERAHIGEAGEAHGEEVAIGVKRKLGRDIVIAAVAVGDETAGALVGPLHRPAERARGMQHADIFRKYRGLHAERAADLAGQDAHVFGVDAERLGDVGAHAENALRADIKREAAAVVDCDRSARLHGVDDERGC